MIKTMTVKQYLENPAGKGVSIYSNLSAMKEKYQHDLLSVNDDIKYRWYTIKDKYLYCHVSLPSQNTKGVYYDVVIEFDIGNNTKNLGNLLESPIRVFSNCPSFIFTYANVFDTYGLLIPWLKDKLNSSVYRKDPEVRNPYKMISFEKSIYLSLLYLSKGRLTYNLVVPLATEIQDYQVIKTRIQSDEKVINLYKSIKKREKIQKEKLKKEEARQQRKEIYSSSQKSTIKKHNSSIKSINSISKNKNNKKVKHI